MWTLISNIWEKIKEWFEPFTHLYTNPKREDNMVEYNQKALDDILHKVTGDLSAKFVYTFDEDNYNREEDWRIPEDRDDGTVRDDCDGYALYLWKQLKEEYDIPSRIIFCEIPTREGWGGHAVLYCEGWIMDCNHYYPFRKDSVNWRWIRMSDEYLSVDGWRDIDT